MNRVTIAGLSLTAATLVSIAVHEGYRERAYDDGVGVQTVGFGTTAGVRTGDKIDPVRALIRLEKDADRFQREMRACLGDVDLYPHEWDAYVSLAYNIGSGAVCRSTLAKKLRQRPPDYPGACREILRWDRAGGKQVPGLSKRRQAEYQLCIGGGK